MTESQLGRLPSFPVRFKEDGMRVCHSCLGRGLADGGPPGPVTQRYAEEWTRGFVDAILGLRPWPDPDCPEIYEAGYRGGRRTGRAGLSLMETYGVPVGPPVATEPMA